MQSFIVAITGASGSVYGIRLIEALLEARNRVHLVISKQAYSIITHETGIDFSGKTDREREKKVRKHVGSDTVRLYHENSLEAPIASGSFLTDGMFVVPCSMKTLSGIANGYANTLIERAADVVMKEGRRLIVSPREMPFSPVHLENMLKLARLGVSIAAPVPAFYHRPGDMNEVIDFVVGKILDAAHIEHSLFQRWK